MGGTGATGPRDRPLNRFRSEAFPEPTQMGYEAMNHEFARQLRKNMTDEERRLWRELRYRQLHGFRFRRQAPIGPFIVDFVCFEQKLIVELDGGQHAERIREDAARTSWLAEQGFRVIRFWNHHVVEDLDAVLEVIAGALQVTPGIESPQRTFEREEASGRQYPPTPTLPHKGGGRGGGAHRCSLARDEGRLGSVAWTATRTSARNRPGGGPSAPHRRSLRRRAPRRHCTIRGGCP